MKFCDVLLINYYRLFNDFTHRKLMFIMELKVQFKLIIYLYLSIFYGQCYKENCGEFKVSIH